MAHLVLDVGSKSEHVLLFSASGAKVPYFCKAVPRKDRRSSKACAVLGELGV